MDCKFDRDSMLHNKSIFILPENGVEYEKAKVQFRDKLEGPFGISLHAATFINIYTLYIKVHHMFTKHVMNTKIQDVYKLRSIDINTDRNTDFFKPEVSKA